MIPLCAFVVALAALAVVLQVPILGIIRSTRSIPLAVLTAWVVFFNINTIVGYSIWQHDSFATSWSGYGYCDIVARLLVASSVGINCCLIATCRYLHRSINLKNGLPFRQTRSKWDNRIDLLICIGPPVVNLGLGGLIMNQRFLLFDNNGCMPSLDDTWMTMLLDIIWAPITALIAAAYSANTIRLYLQCKKELGDHLNAMKSALTSQKYLRVLILCTIVVIVVVPYSFATLVVNALSTSSDSYSLQNVYSPTWSYIYRVPYSVPYYDTYIFAVIGYVIFGCFGFGKEAQEHYRNIWERLKRCSCQVFDYFTFKSDRTLHSHETSASDATIVGYGHAYEKEPAQGRDDESQLYDDDMYYEDDDVFDGLRLDEEDKYRARVRTRGVVVATSPSPTGSRESRPSYNMELAIGKSETEN